MKHRKRAVIVEILSRNFIALRFCTTRFVTFSDVLAQKIFDVRATKSKAEKRERLDTADQLIKQFCFSYVWYDAEAGSNNDDVSDALLMVGTQTDLIVVDSTGHLVGRFFPTNSLYVAGSLEKKPSHTAPKLRLVVNNDDCDE